MTDVSAPLAVPALAFPGPSSRDRFFSLRRSNARCSRKHSLRPHCITLDTADGVVRISQDGVPIGGFLAVYPCIVKGIGIARGGDTVSCVEPRSQLMRCLRCHGLMVTIRLEDVGSSSLCFSGWQCLMCGEVIDSVIRANRKELHGATGSRGRIRYGVSLGHGRSPSKATRT